jgi:hypothetical protein
MLSDSVIVEGGEDGISAGLHCATGWLMPLIPWRFLENGRVSGSRIVYPNQ